LVADSEKRWSSSSLSDVKPLVGDVQ